MHMRREGSHLHASDLRRLRRCRTDEDLSCGEPGSPADPGSYDLPAGRPACAALRRAVRPAHPEPAPLPRLRRPVLSHHRTPKAPCSARGLAPAPGGLSEEQALSFWYKMRVRVWL